MLLRRCSSAAFVHDGYDTIHQELDIHPDFREAVQRAGLDSFDALMLTAGEASLEKPKLGGWRERLVLQLGGSRLFLKRYQWPPWRQQLTTRLRGFGTTAEVERHWLDRIRRAGIDVPDPVIYGARHRRGIEIASLLATKQVPGQSLERWVRGSGARKLDDRPFKLELIEATAALGAPTA